MRRRIGQLRACGLQFTQQEQENSLEQIFAGQVWAVTGSFEHFNPRSLALKELEKRGARTVSSITGKTTHLLLGTGGGSKRKTAEELGVRIVDEKEFMELLGRGGKEGRAASGGQLSFDF